MDRKKQIFHNNTITTSTMFIARTEYLNVHCRFENLDVCSFEKSPVAVSREVGHFEKQT